MAKTKKVRPSQRARADTEAARPRKAERQTLPRKAKHYKDLLQTQASSPQTRKLIEGAVMPEPRYIRTADAAFLDETPENPMSTEHAFEEQIAARRERNTRYGRDASREEALAQLVNEAAIPLWEPRPAVQPRARRGASGPVVDDF